MEAVSYDDLDLELRYVADFLRNTELWPYEESLHKAAKLILELQKDALRYRWLLENAHLNHFGWDGYLDESIDRHIDEAMQREGR